MGLRAEQKFILSGRIDLIAEQVGMETKFYNGKAVYTLIAIAYLVCPLVHAKGLSLLSEAVLLGSLRQ